MITPDSATTSTGSARKFKLPLAALAVEGTTPAQGDEITLTITGRLGSVTGEEGEIEVTTVNGEPIAEAAPEMSEDDQALDVAKKADADAY